MSSPGPIKMTWMGQDYVLSEREVFEVADQIEDVCTIFDLARMANNPRFVRLAKCYAIMLREAGADVTDREIHREFMAELASKKGADKMALAMNAINSLLAVLMHGAPKGDDSAPEKSPGG